MEVSLLDTSIVLAVTDESGIGEARRQARRCAAELGLDEVTAERAAIAASEAARNAVVHGRGGKLAAVQHVVHARERERRGLVDRPDARRRIRTRQQRDVPSAGKGDIGGEAPLVGDEAAVLAHAAVGGDETEARRRRGHDPITGRLRPRMRSAASATASTICA